MTMKNLLFLFVMFLIPGITFPQDNKMMGKVNKIQGKEVYVMCEPIREYQVVDKVSSTVAQLVGISPTISNMVSTMVNRAVTKETKGKVDPWDAFITSDGNSGILIKFKEGGEENKGVGTVTKMLGKEIYIMCEPLREYETVDKVSSAFAQILGISPSIDKMVQTMVETAVEKESKGKIGNFDAVITSDGDNAICVKFK
jgi:hypothetical protein